MRAEDWFPYSTPMVVSGLSPWAASTSITIEYFGGFLPIVAAEDPSAARLLQLRENAAVILRPSPTYDHGTAEGYRQTGIMAYQALMHGRNTLPYDSRVVKRLSESRTSDATLTIDDELYYPFRAGRSYRVEFSFETFANNATGALKFTLDGPTATLITTCYEVQPNGAAVSTVATIGYPTGVNTGNSGLFYIRGGDDGSERHGGWGVCAEVGPERFACLGHSREQRFVHGESLSGAHN